MYMYIHTYVHVRTCSAPVVRREHKEGGVVGHLEGLVLVLHGAYVVLHPVLQLLAFVTCMYAHVRTYTCISMDHN